MEKLAYGARISSLNIQFDLLKSKREIKIHRKKNNCKQMMSKAELQCQEVNATIGNDNNRFNSVKVI